MKTHDVDGEEPGMPTWGRGQDLAAVNCKQSPLDCTAALSNSNREIQSIEEGFLAELPRDQSCLLLFCCLGQGCSDLTGHPFSSLPSFCWSRGIRRKQHNGADSERYQSSSVRQSPGVLVGKLSAPGRAKEANMCFEIHPRFPCLWCPPQSGTLEILGK